MARRMRSIHLAGGVRRAAGPAHGVTLGLRPVQEGPVKATSVISLPSVLTSRVDLISQEKGLCVLQAHFFS